MYKRSPFGLTLPELYRHAANNFGDRDFIVYEDIRMSYQEVFSQVKTLAAALTSTYGVVKGDRVAVSMRNFPEWCIAFMAATAIGAIAVPTNSLWNEVELEYGMNNSGTKVCSPSCLCCSYPLPPTLDPFPRRLLCATHKSDCLCLISRRMRASIPAGPVRG